MAEPTQLQLQGQPPVWATGDQPGFFWYFVNEYGEQWVAKLVGSKLVFACSDVDWKEIWFGRQKALAVLNACKVNPATAEFGWPALGDTIVGRAEMAWACAVIAAALPHLGN